MNHPGTPLETLNEKLVATKEGGIGWFDGLAVANSAPNLSGALSFIDYMVDPTFYVEWATKVGAPASANVKANEALPAEDVGRQIHSDQAAIKRLQFMAPLTEPCESEVSMGLLVTARLVPKVS